MIIPKNSSDEIKIDQIKIAEILAMGFDLIVKYELDNNGTIRTIPVLMKHLPRFLENNQGEFLIDLLKYYLSTTKTIKILKIMKYKHIIFKQEDFRIKILDKRIYGNMALFYVNIYNRKTGVFFEDWIKPFQIELIRELNHLICWESEGDEIDFF